MKKHSPPQALTEIRQEASQKECSLRILGKHLSGVQKARRQLEERLQRAENELRDAASDIVLCGPQVRESLVQSRGTLSAQPRPMLLPREPLELSGAESIMGAPEMAACQSLLSVVSQLCHTCSSRIDWLEQEVSALCSELQGACLRDNLALAPVSLVTLLFHSEFNIFGLTSIKQDSQFLHQLLLFQVTEFPENFPFAGEETPSAAPAPDSNSTPSQSNPAPPNPQPKRRRKKP
uniref:Uncharacterized protein n=1 Tax=Echeneis naucrates TaxID=173247 RepID=A0A665U425_ECHNA